MSLDRIALVFCFNHLAYPLLLHVLKLLHIHSLPLLGRDFKKIGSHITSFGA